MTRMENFSPNEGTESLDVINSPYTGNCQATLTVKSAVCDNYCVKLVDSPCQGGSKNLPRT